MSSTCLPGSMAAAVPSSPVALRAMRTSADTSGSWLIRIAVARPMPWLAPGITQTLPIVSRRGRCCPRRSRVPARASDGPRQDPDRRARIAVEQAGVLGERGAVASGRFMGRDQCRTVELLRKLDVDQLVALEQ